MQGQTGVSSNTLAVSCILGLQSRKKTLITHTHYEHNNLEAPLIGMNANEFSEKQIKDLFIDVGIDALIRNFKAESLQQEIIESCCISFPNTNILLLPGSTQKNKSFFQHNVENMIPTLIGKMEPFFDVIVTDVISGRNELSFQLMEQADLVVVNLSQNIKLIEQYFTLFHKDISDISKRIFFLFGNYNDNSKYNIHNIRRKYHKYFNHRNSGVIPSSCLFLDAQNDNRLIEFIQNGLQSEQEEEQSKFILKAMTAAEKMLEYT